MSKKLAERQIAMAKGRRYYDGNHPTPDMPRKIREEFAKYVLRCKSNFMALVVDSVEERLNIEGFRFGDSLDADADAWKIWQANNLDAESQLAHNEALITGYAYVLVTPTGGPNSIPLITVESPHEAIVTFESGNRRRRALGLKRWIGDDKRHYATLFTPTEAFRFRTKAKPHKGTTFSTPRS